ncbi:MAG: hypothetical protein BWY12_02429 [candidate division BRC1 bacterium ADurb.Bin183]|nr:MAG: hypothetical protein BWY12_02429 [candidate division BRC1 bacterium ADurb.Bin183]
MKILLILCVPLFIFFKFNTIGEEQVPKSVEGIDGIAFM